jgi:hypothetical protein
MCQARPEDWAGLSRRKDAFPTDILLFGVRISLNSKGYGRVFTCAERKCSYHGDGEKWVDTSGMSQPEWRIILHVKGLIEALRNLMKSTLVDDDKLLTTHWRFWESLR